MIYIQAKQLLYKVAMVGQSLECAARRRLTDHRNFANKKFCLDIYSLYRDKCLFTIILENRQSSRRALALQQVLVDIIFYYYQVVLNDSQPDKTHMDRFLSSVTTLMFHLGGSHIKYLKTDFFTTDVIMLNTKGLAKFLFYCIELDNHKVASLTALNLVF